MKRKKIKSENGRLIDGIYEAVVAYVEANGGSVSVVGGIQLIEDRPYKGHNFAIAVKCTGAKPVFKVPA